MVELIVVAQIAVNIRLILRVPNSFQAFNGVPSSVNLLPLNIYPLWLFCLKSNIMLFDEYKTSLLGVMWQ